MRAEPGFSLVKMTPTQLSVLDDRLWRPGTTGVQQSARVLVLGGEALAAESLQSWREHAPATRLINEYGPTEATVGCCVYETRPSDPQVGPVPIGRPIANTRIYVLDRHLQQVPIGVSGELCIAGASLARGYLNRPALTAMSFVPDPFGPPGSRLYRTGDLARWRPDGELSFLGRLDHQIKIRGFRVELGEIEVALVRHPAIREAVVIMTAQNAGSRLIAYAVPPATRALESANYGSTCRPRCLTTCCPPQRCGSRHCR